MIRRILAAVFPAPTKAETHYTHTLASCPECLAFVNSVAALRLAKHLSCHETGHGMNQAATIGTLTRVILLMEAQAHRKGLRNKEAR